MASTIIERIRREKDARQRVRDAILGRDAVGVQPHAAAPGLDRQAVLACFSREVVPIVGQAVTAEVTAALDRVKKELLSFLERELARLTAPRAAAVEEPGVAETDTDLDLPADEVVREIDRVLAEIGPRIEPEVQKEPELLKEPELHLPPEPPEEVEVPPEPPEPPEPPLRPITAAADPRPEPRPARTVVPVPPAPVQPPLEAAAQPKRTPAPAEPRAEARSERIAPAAAAEPPLKPAPVTVQAALPLELPLAAREERAEAPETATDRVEEMRDALIPGIADAISRVAGELERGQQRIALQVAALGKQVTGLEERLRARAGPGPGQEEPEWAGGPGGGRLEKLEESILLAIRESEGRLSGRIDLLAGPAGEEQHS